MQKIHFKRPISIYRRYRNYFIVSFVCWFFLFQDKYFEFISPLTFTGWDTHGWVFRNFLYFRDSLSSGIIPFWNPYIQSGSTFLNINNVGFFYPFEFFFVGLGLVINPLLAYEIWVQCIIVIGGLGLFLLLKRRGIDQDISFFGALMFSIVVLSPLVGQIGYAVSFGSLPWLLLACDKLSDKSNAAPLQWLLWGILFVFYISAGYFWLNIIILVIGFIFAALKVCIRECKVDKWKPYKHNWISEPSILFLFTIGSLLTFIMTPGLLNMRFNYSLLNGDFISPDGRLRGLKSMGGGAGHGGALETLIGNIDPLISKNQPWWKEFAFNYGAGWTIWIFFIFTLSIKWSKQQFFWLTIAVLGIIYSAGGETTLGKFISQIPVINGNRYWLGVGTSFASIALLFVIIEKISFLSSAEITIRETLIRLSIIVFAFLGLLNYLHSPISLYILVLANGFLIALFCLYKSSVIRFLILSLLLGLNIFVILFSPYRAESNSPLTSQVFQEIDQRKIEITSNDNFRKLDLASSYNYWDTDWLYKKILFNHGYNHLGSPQYWYIKTNPFLRDLIVISQEARPDGDIKRVNYKNDNEYLEKVAAEVMVDPFTPLIERQKYSLIVKNEKFDSKITNLKIDPNQILFNVSTNDRAHVFINSIYAPGWHLFVNGIERQMYSANHIFVGFDLPRSGIYSVKFVYKPYIEIFCLSIPYLALLLYLTLKILRWYRVRKI